MRIPFERLVRWYSRNSVFQSTSEVNRNPYCEQFSAAGKRVWQSSALVSPTKTLNTDQAPIGDDIEPIEASREDVETRSDEDAEVVGWPVVCEFLMVEHGNFKSSMTVACADL